MVFLSSLSPPTQSQLQIIQNTEESQNTFRNSFELGCTVPMHLYIAVRARVVYTHTEVLSFVIVLLTILGQDSCSLRIRLSYASTLPKEPVETSSSFLETGEPFGAAVGPTQ